MPSMANTFNVSSPELGVRVTYTKKIWLYSESPTSLYGLTKGVSAKYAFQAKILLSSKVTTTLVADLNLPEAAEVPSLDPLES